MPKEQFRETEETKIVSHLSFEIEDAASIRQLSQIQVVTNVLYNTDPQRTPCQYGALDKRLGTISKDSPCETCGKTLNDCVGHEGFIEMEQPVFHVGFFKNVINILQSVCKNCARVLLPVGEQDNYRMKMINPNLSYLIKKELRKKIIEKCKKVKKCLHCGEVNGTVSKMTNAKSAVTGTFMNIVHEKKKAAKKRHLDSDDEAEEDPEAAHAEKLECVLTPIDVYYLFERIPVQDIYLLGMDPKKNLPKDLLLSRMLVPPVTIRPSVASDIKSGTTEDHLTIKCSLIVHLNYVAQRHKLNGANPLHYQQIMNCLQLQTAHYINAEVTGVPPKLKKDLPKNAKGVVQRLKGKTGRFRGNLSGKRVDFSSRTVISPDPNLEIDQVGVPEYIACILTYPERVTKFNVQKVRQMVINGPDKWPGANYILLDGVNKKFLKYVNREKQAQSLKIGDTVLRHLQDNDIVLFNRQPSLHRLSIMSHRVKVHKHRTFRFNECVCNPYNADFDGDEMNLHLPQTEEAKAEASVLMANKHNLVTPRNGELLIGATQDFLTGAYLLTRQDRFFTRAEALDLASTLSAGDDAQLRIDFPPPCIMKPKRLWSGKQIISLIFSPNRKYPVKANLEIKGKHYKKNREFCRSDSYVIVRNSELLAGTFEKCHLGSSGKCGNIFYVILRDFAPDFSIKSMWRLARMTSFYLMSYPGFTIGIGDVTPCRSIVVKKEKLVRHSYEECSGYIRKFENGTLEKHPGTSPEETMEMFIIKELSAIRDFGGKACLEELPIINSPLVMALSGSKGSDINIAQMVVCVGQQALSGKRVPDGYENRSLPHFKLFSKTPQAKGFVKNSFYTGLTPTEFLFHTMAGREGLVDTAVKTATTGYMQRRLVKCLEDLAVHYDGTVRNADGDVIQFEYGCDSLDPLFMEGNNIPVNFDRLLAHIRAKCPFRDEPALSGRQIRIATNAFLEQNGLDECSQSFKQDVINFMEDIAKEVDSVREKHDKSDKSDRVVAEIKRLTCSQLVTFLETCAQKFVRSKIEPGTAVGALAAQSIGEPGTQMTLKTFHFAGVASMNITQGVPRIMEIINACKNISTPIITAHLREPHNPFFAREVKGRIEKTTLGQIATFTKECVTDKVFIIVRLNYLTIMALKLEVNVDTVRYSICTTSKLKLKPIDVHVRDKSTISIDLDDDRSPRATRLNYAMNDLILQLPKVIVKGIPTVSRAVIMKDDEEGQAKYKLYVEGTNLREVMATYGVLGEKTGSNNVMEVFETLGIEAARETISREIQGVLEHHGMSVDHRHIMLLASQMTHTGSVLGYTRHGLEKMKQSVLNLASFEKTADHLFDAAYFGQTDRLNGVSESIIMGIPAPLGTGMFKLLYNFPKEEGAPECGGERACEEEQNYDSSLFEEIQ